MTFDQQTQTRTNMQGMENDLRSGELLLQQEILSEQMCSLAEENFHMKQQLNTVQTEIREIKTCIHDIKAQLTNLCDSLHVPTYSDDSVSCSAKATGAIDESQKSIINPPRILNLTNQLNSSTSQTLSYSSMSIEPMIEASNDSILSYSNQSYASPSTSFQSIYHVDTSNTSDSSFNSSMKIKQNLSKCNNKMEKCEKHTDDDGNPSDEVIIGPNQTTIPRSVLMNINWTSHTSATRRLLRAKFTREVLATHSLTGKPSPGICSSVEYFYQKKNIKILFFLFI